MDLNAYLKSIGRKSDSSFDIQSKNVIQPVEPGTIEPPTPVMVVSVKPSATVVSETSFGQSSNKGQNDSFSRGDHTHGTPTIQVDGVTISGDGSLTSPLKAELTQGEKGDTGATGPQGIRGLTGLTGPQGPQGERGLTGETGPQGIQGLTGARGATGLTGSTGSAGPQGAQGIQGLTGPQGERGLQGDAGPTGPQGPQGETGPRGLTGTPGADSTVAGPAGAKVVDADFVGNDIQFTLSDASTVDLVDAKTTLKGEKGDTGAAGANGADGATGPAGPQGPQGLRGVQGIQGEAGADSTVPGPRGPQGETGPASTVPGPQGETGPQGPQGIQGLRGIQGIQGDQGVQGPQGATGSTGATGQGFTNKGAWSSSTSYVPYDVVTNSGSSYVCILAVHDVILPGNDAIHWTIIAQKGDTGAQGERGTTGATGATGNNGLTGPAGQGYNNRSAWISGTSYLPYDVVSNSGSSYVCKSPVSGTTIPGSDTGHWDLLAAKGDTGNLPSSFDTLQMKPAPTVGSFSEGKIFYDETWKTLAVDIDTDVTLQIGQEDLRRVYNNTGAKILNGQAVYTTGVHSDWPNDCPTIALAQANSETTSFVIGCATQDININSYGFVTVRGNINDLDTSTGQTWNAGDSLYLSATVAGGLTSVIPSAPNLEIRVGRLITKSTTLGRINIHIDRAYALTDLSNVTTTNPVADDFLKFNGSEWVNGPGGTVSAGAGVDFYFDSTTILATGNDNVNKIETLSKSPSGNVEKIEQKTVNNQTLMGDAYLYNIALNRTSLTAGTWSFPIYAGVSRTQGVSEFLHSVYKVSVGNGNVVISGTAGTTTRTATKSGEFTSDKVNVGGTIDSDSYLQTVNGLFRILTRVSDNAVTIEVPSTYTNENPSASFYIWKRLFQVTTGEMNNITGASPYAGIILYDTKTVQPAYTVIASDELGVIRFPKTTDTSDNVLSIIYEGTSRYSHVETPLSTLHGNLQGLQGGSGSVPTEEYYHLTNAQHTIATQAATDSVNGYLTAVDHALFAKPAVDVIIQAVEGTTDIAINATGIAYFTIPSKMNGFKLKSVYARVITAGSTGSANLFNFLINGTAMLSTALMINASAVDSSTAATPYVIDTAHDDVATNDLISVTCSQINGVAPKGLIVQLNFGV